MSYGLSLEPRIRIGPILGSHEPYPDPEPYPMKMIMHPDAYSNMLRMAFGLPPISKDKS